jgi:hypothetical protein
MLTLLTTIFYGHVYDCLKIIVGHVDYVFTEWCVGLIVCAQVILAGSISFPFLKDGPVCPTLKEMRKKALKHLSLALREFDQPYSWLPIRYFWVLSQKDCVTANLVVGLTSSQSKHVYFMYSILQTGLLIMLC